MTDRPNNVERLLSERGDGILTPAELSRLQEIIREDAQMAATARQYDRLNVLLKGWRALPSAVNWAELSQRTRRMVASEGAAETAGLASVDRMLRDWAGPMPEVNWEALRRRISAAVGQEAALLESRQLHQAGRAGRFGRLVAGVARVAVPLAAAAAVALMAWWPRTELGPQPSASGGSLVAVAWEVPRETGEVRVRVVGGEYSEASAGGDTGPLVRLRFDSAAAPPSAEPPVENGMTFVAAGETFDYARGSPRGDEADDEIIFY